MKRFRGYLLLILGVVVLVSIFGIVASTQTSNAKAQTKELLFEKNYLKLPKREPKEENRSTFDAIKLLPKE
jgi:signal transduction histidine kinase